MSFVSRASAVHGGPLSVEKSWKLGKHGTTGNRGAIEPFIPRRGNFGNWIPRFPVSVSRGGEFAIVGGEDAGLGGQANVSSKRLNLRQSSL